MERVAHLLKILVGTQTHVNLTVISGIVAMGV